MSNNQNVVTVHPEHSLAPEEYTVINPDDSQIY